MGRGLVAQCHQLSVFVRGHRKSLLGPSALAGRVEHLWSREGEFHGSLHELRGRGGEQSVAPLKSFRAKCAADEWTDNAHIFAR